MDPFPPPLQYQSPIPVDASSVVWRGQDVRIELGPASTPAFAAMLTPAAFWLLLDLAWVAMMIGDRTAVAPGWWVAGAGVGIVALWLLLQTIRFRTVPRVVVASLDQIGFSDPTTAGRLILIDARQIKVVRVFRNWWRPWVCQLLAQPTAGQFSLTGPVGVVLVTDTDRRRLQYLGGVIDSARRPPVAHVRGAFDVVIPVRQDDGRAT